MFGIAHYLVLLPESLDMRLGIEAISHLREGYSNLDLDVLCEASDRIGRHRLSVDSLYESARAMKRSHFHVCAK